MSQLQEKEEMMRALREIFLENGYSVGLGNLAKFDFSEIPNFTIEHYKMFDYDLSHHLNQDFWDIVEIYKYNTPHLSKSTTSISFFLLDKGFIEKEQDFTHSNSKLIVEILEFIDHLPDVITDANEILTKLKNTFPSIDLNKILTTMKHCLNDMQIHIILGLDTRFNQVLPSNCITEYGFDILRRYYDSKDIFNNTPNKDIMLKEHHWIFRLKNQGNIKDAIIKMGSVIEYVVYNWLSSNGHPTPSKFQNKLDFLEHHSRSTPNFPISVGNIRIVNSLIRDYRNFIHLQKYFDDNIILSLNDFNQLLPIYSEILKEMS